jgi:hypothetical protein
MQISTSNCTKRKAKRVTKSGDTITRRVTGISLKRVIRKLMKSIFKTKTTGKKRVRQNRVPV